MAPTKPKKAAHKSKARNRVRAKAASAQNTNINARELLAQATAFLEEGDAESAATIARAAYQRIGEGGRLAGAALSLLGQIHVELGEIGAAREFFLAAVKVDEDGSLPDDVGGGPEKFLWLAQLSEEGGHDSVSWFERGAAALRAQIQTLTESLDSRPLTRDAQEAVIAEKRKRLAETLCAVVEVYMTDLSWEEDAEQRCEALITEATMLAPESAETWQTVANVRISQTRTEEAREALKRSLGLWTHLEPEDPAVPPFPSRVSLVRLLIEVDMEEQAMAVTERLIAEDDRSVEVLYLGGYARYLRGEKLKNKDQASDVETWKASWRSARKWLAQCLKVFQQEEYEDERLGEHARELLESIKGELGESAEDEDDEDAWEDTDGEEDWEGVDSDEDTEMY
ncbi:773709e9-f197-4a41-bbfa-d3f107a1833a [Thermothielavioides terrestris]|uniref:773709e9-f197-4a41-bbfa-d3f107a1833a n=1 Tax=Thermothielavioides terrestris TaxID=2587410 RepID=A0A446B8Z0_9PEZI|nr:773709e9-f197-4a41-bbfa-d3f107a1833a [Thermothielavioides terrestris]